MKKALVKLIDLKSIITLIFTVFIMIFTYKGIVGPELFIAEGTAVFTYYFTKKATDDKEE